MPTDEWFKENPKVSAYIPKELNEKLLEWMQSRNVKKVSQALTVILEEHLGVAQKVVQTEPPTDTQPVEDDRIESLEQKFENLSQVVQELREAIQASSLQVVQTELIQETLPLLDAIAAIESKQPTAEELQDDEPDEILHEFLEPENQKTIEEPTEKEVGQSKPNKSETWTTNQIKEILGVSRGNLERWNREGTLPKSAKGHTILRWAGKQEKKPFSNLWEVEPPQNGES